jgi:hypothetical protein
VTGHLDARLEAAHAVLCCTHAGLFTACSCQWCMQCPLLQGSVPHLADDTRHSPVRVRVCGA